jgi:hypothetical protein
MNSTATNDSKPRPPLRSGGSAIPGGGKQVPALIIAGPVSAPWSGPAIVLMPFP